MRDQYVKTQQAVPPRDFTILVDEQGGGYDKIAQQYRQLFEKRGVNLTVRPVASALDALKMLE